jgi:prepilin-type N-terminal cleavage/methylation domain-containing protein
MQQDSKKAFTLFELLIVLSILSVTVLLLVPVGIQMLRQTTVEEFAREISSTMFTQQQRAFNGLDDIQHGVAFQGNQLIAFGGDSLGSATYTELYDLPGGMSFSSINLLDAGSEIRFRPNELEPSTTGSVDVTKGQVTYRISINAIGAIEIDLI